MAKVILIKGKYQFKRQLTLCITHGKRVLASGSIKTLNRKVNLEFIKTIYTKWTPGDTHYIIIEE